MIHLLIITALLAFFKWLLPKKHTEKHALEARRIYLEILHCIETADYPGDMFWIDQQIQQWESYYMELIDRDSHIRMYNDMTLRAGQKERRLLSNLGIKQLN